MLPSAASAAARLAVIVDLPTPPLPDATQITFFTWARAPCGKLVAAQRLLKVRLLVVGEDVELDGDGRDALDLADVLRDRVDEMGADRAARGGEGDDHAHAPVVGDVDRAHHAELDDVLAELGVDDGAKLVRDLLFGGETHPSILTGGLSGYGELHEAREPRPSPVRLPRHGSRRLRRRHGPARPRLRRLEDGRELVRAAAWPGALPVPLRVGGGGVAPGHSRGARRFATPTASTS